MKKIFSISIATVVVVGVAGIIFAQATTTLSIVEKMKAASHDFTLASELNVGQTDLKSGPLSGKKTGGIVTAEDYNRILEMLSEISSSTTSVATGDSVVIKSGVASSNKCTGTLTGGLCAGSYYVDVVFDQEFSEVPHVIVAPNWISDQGGCVGSTTDMISSSAANITTKGFRMYCAGSPMGGSTAGCGIYEGHQSIGKCNWLAIQAGGEIGNGGSLTTEKVRVVCPTGPTSGCAANCPTGTTVVGGGVEWLSTNGTCHVATSYPKDNGWIGSTSATNSGTTSCGAAVHAICMSSSSEGTPQTSSWSITCGWDGWYDSRTHGGSYPTGGKGNVMSFFCKSGKLTAVKWNKGSGTVNTDLTSGVNCNFDGTQAMDPQDFDGGSDEYMVVCSGGYLTGLRARTNSWSAGATVTPGEQPTCTTSLRFWSRGIGYMCTDGKVSAISNS